MREYLELKTAGLSDQQIAGLRNSGATHAAILHWAKAHVHPQCVLCEGQELLECRIDAAAALHAPELLKLLDKRRDD